MLLSEGLITQAQLDAALKAQAERGLPIGQLLVEDGAVTEAVLMGALARQLGLAVVDLRAVTGSEVAIVVATRTQLTEAIDRFHRLDAEVDEVAQIAAEEL